MKRTNRYTSLTLTNSPYRQGLKDKSTKERNSHMADCETICYFL